MGRVFLPQGQATPYTPKAGETFNDAVGKCDKVSPPIAPEEVAQFNWGAVSDSEILRALVEQVGCQDSTAIDPSELKLNPKNGLKGKILLPKVWKKSGLGYEKVHKLTVKKSLPATAISITGLDAWFLPGEENCGIFYQLEGIKDRAQILDFDVYASNYCKATAQVNNDLVDYTYSDTPDVPILQRSISTEASERENGEVEDWKGESEAASGVLAKRDTTRYINAASSPYTVVLRYSKTAAKTAFVNIKSFWPRWSGDASSRSLVADSLKVKWTTKNCPGGLQGQIQLFDKDDIVWRQYLPPAKCGNGDQDFDLPAEAKAKIEEDRMPYRVQIQLHTDKDTDNGFAIAAMHTEVRLFTHPEIGTFGDNHEQEPQVLPQPVAPFYAGTAPPDDSAKGRKLRLAKAGYHPGPVADGEGQAPYLQAVKEFQRDHTKQGSTERLKADGTIDGSTKTAISALAPGRRPLFAGQDRQNLTDNDKINSAVSDKEVPIVVWLDDRHNYTEVDAASKKVLLPNMDLENYRGPMDGVDVKQAKDEASICRPWIPLQVTIPVLRKSDSLTSSSVPEVTDASRAVTGPIRVDWTFRDLEVEYNIDTTDYTATRTRPHKHLEDDFNAIKGSHNGKDAWNCTDALGGIRGADYYKAPFGTDNDNSLMPWKALGDSGVSAVCSVAHDDLGQDKAQLFSTHLGAAGVYFHPSIIGGDGYQLRAQVSFRDLPSGSTHPNWKVLRDRYDVTKLAQVHSAPVRLWRKDTMRAYTLWAPKDECHWDDNGSRNTVFIKYYEPGMVQFEYEGGAAPVVPLNTIMTKDDYLKTLSDNITGTMGTDVTTDIFRPKSEWQFDPENLWPWVKSKHMGINAVPDPTVTVDQYEPGFLDAKIWDVSWYQYSAPLILLLLSHVEKNKGAMRGHFITEFRSSPTFWKETYTCSQCATKEILIELTAAGGTGAGEPCRTPACTGTLQSSVTETYTCDVCGFSKTASVSENLEGTACTKPCGGTLSVVSTTPGTTAGMNTTVYQCSVCGHQITVTEATASAGSRAGTVCGQPCTGHLRGDPSTRTAQVIQETGFGSLTFPAIGESLGALWLMTDGGNGGPRTFWAHEVGHHKHMEHAGATAQGSKPAQHDSANNTVDAKLLAHPPQAGDGNWDRTCIMSYTSAESVTRLDAGYFCGKCILKLRGWKVEGLSNPGAGVQGP